MTKRTVVEEAVEQKDSVEVTYSKDGKVAYNIKVYGDDVDVVVGKVKAYKDKLIADLDIKIEA